jgi:hypothetical protein
MPLLGIIVWKTGMCAQQPLSLGATLSHPDFVSVARAEKKGKTTPNTAGEETINSTIIVLPPLEWQ